jgi:hypothetical protein
VLCREPISRLHPSITAHCKCIAHLPIGSAPYRRIGVAAQSAPTTTCTLISGLMISAAALALGALGSLNRALCSSWATVLQVHGILPCLLLGTLWWLSGLARLRELRRREGHAAPNNGLAARMQTSTPTTTTIKSASTKTRSSARLHEAAPAVSLVLPTRGCRPHSVPNWRAVLSLDYAGPLEFVFVLEDERDPADTVIKGLIEQLATKDRGLSNGCKPGSHTYKNGEATREARIQLAGQASRTSQKIHK